MFSYLLCYVFFIFILPFLLSLLFFFFPFFLFFYYTSCTLFPTNKPLHPQCRRLIILEYEGELYRVEVEDALVHFLMLSMYCILGRPLLLFPFFSFRECMSLLDTLIVSACMSKEIHFSFDNLDKEFASSLKFIQYALVHN